MLGSQLTTWWDGEDSTFTSVGCFNSIIGLPGIKEIQIVVGAIVAAAGGNHSLWSAFELEKDLLFNRVIDEYFGRFTAWIITLFILVGDLLPVFIVVTNIYASESFHKFFGREEENTVICFDRSNLLSESSCPS